MLFIKDKKFMIILMIFVMGYDILTVMGYDILTALFLKSWDVVLCHWVLRACLTFQSTRALWSFRTSGSVDPATQHNIAGFFMINSSTTVMNERGGGHRIQVTSLQ